MRGASRRPHVPKVQLTPQLRVNASIPNRRHPLSHLRKIPILPAFISTPFFPSSFFSFSHLFVFRTPTIKHGHSAAAVRFHLTPSVSHSLTTFSHFYIHLGPGPSHSHSHSCSNSKPSRLHSSLMVTFLLCTPAIVLLAHLFARRHHLLWWSQEEEGEDGT